MWQPQRDFRAPSVAVSAWQDGDGGEGGLRVWWPSVPSGGSITFAKQGTEGGTGTQPHGPPPKLGVTPRRTPVACSLSGGQGQITRK